MRKEEVRKQLKTVRACIQERVEKDKAIAATVLDLAKKYETVFAYVSMGSEVDTHGILRRLSSSKRLLVPYTDCAKRMHAALPRLPIAFEQVDALGNVPVELRKFFDGQADLILVPLLGFDPEGYRIGYGAGCYDRYFADNPYGLKVGLAYEEQLCVFVHDENDVPLDMIITPKRMIGRTKL